MKFSGKVGCGPVNKWLNFDGDPLTYHDTGKTCLGGGMHCPSASSYYVVSYILIIFNVCISLIIGYSIAGGCLQCFDTWLGVRKSIWPTKIEWWGAGIVIHPPPFPQIDIIAAVVIVWGVRGKTIRSVLCNIVCNNCAQCNAHTYEQT